MAAEPGGRAIFDAASCRACHRIGDVGGNTGPDLAFVGVRHSAAWLDTWLLSPHAWNPKTLMPEFRLSDGDRRALVDYLAGLKGEAYGAEGPPWRRPDAPKEPATLGRLIYNRAGCVACHGVGGEGGHPNNNVQGGAIPALRETVATYTDDELARRILYGRKPDKLDPAGPDPLVEMPAWRAALDENDVRALIAYLRTLKPSITVDW